MSLKLIQYTKKELEKRTEDLKGRCCVCGHDLDRHLDEGTHWRCYSIGRDYFQCECNLSKQRADNNVNYYDTQKRTILMFEQERMIKP